MPLLGAYLKSNRDFQAVYKEGEKKISPHFVLYARPSNLKNPRLGISIASKHIPLATRRNRLKRVMREYWRLTKLKEKKDYVLVIRPKAGRLKNEEFRKELNNFFNKNLS